MIKVYNDELVEAKIYTLHDHTEGLPFCKYCNYVPVLFYIDHNDNRIKTCSIRCSNTECNGHDQKIMFDYIEHAQKEWINLNLHSCYKCNGEVEIIEAVKSIELTNTNNHVFCKKCGWLFTPSIRVSMKQLANSWNEWSVS